MSSASLLRRVLLIAWLSLVLIPGCAWGQLRGGDYVVADFQNDSILRVTPSGAVSTLYGGAPLVGPSGVAATRDREVVVADFNSSTLFLISPAGAISPIAAGVTSPIRLAVDVNGDYIVTSLTSGSLLRVTPGGSVSTITSGFTRPFGVAVEPTGDYLVTEDTSGRLSRVSRDGTMVTPLSNGLGLAQGVALFADGDYAVFSGNPDQVLRVPRAGGAGTLLVGSQPLGNPCGIVGDFAGGLALSESGNPNGNRLVGVDANGNLTVIAAAAFPAGVNLEDLARIPHMAGPTQVMTGPGAIYSLGLDFPGDAGLGYVLVASASVYPGLSGPGDPRGSPLNADLLFALTLGGLPPVTTGWTGALDAAGTASPGLDLSTLAPGSLSGATIHVQAITLAGTAPTGIQSFGNVVSLLFP